ncbi:CopM family metallochaperone [Azospirillum ramasamyi]|nr:DUF305 domain-containing protein [Azospirillum ramasamyi]
MTTTRCRRILAPCAAALALIAGTALAQPGNPSTNPSGNQPGTAATHDRMQGHGQDHAQGHAQGHAQDHATPSDHLPHELTGDPASQAYMDGMRKMDRDMSKPMTGDADQDFARMMLAHHQGAVDMAKVQLQYGKDPELLALSRKIIDDQTREIAQLQDWLKRLPAKPARNEGAAAKTPE